MEFTQVVTVFIALFLTLTAICYKVTRKNDEPMWLNIICAAFIAFCFTSITLLIALVLITPSHAIPWQLAKEIISEDIEKNHVGILVENLQDSNNVTMKSDIQSTLNKYKFTQTYKENIFDCSDSSTITQQILIQHGYQAMLLGGADTRKNTSTPYMWHMWVAVRDPEGNWIMIETTKQKTIGKVITRTEKTPEQYHYFTGGQLLNNSNEYAYLHQSDATTWNALNAMTEA